MLNLIIFVVCFALAVIVSQKTKINMGFMGIFFAFIIGRLVADVPRKEILGYFPTTIAMTLIMACFFFGFMRRTDVFKGVADRIMWAFRKKPALIPFAVYAATFVVAALGAGNYATPAIMAPLAFELASELGFNPMLSAIAVWGGSVGTSQMLHMSNNANNRNYITQYIGEEFVNKGLIWIVITVNLILVLGFVFEYIIHKGYKAKGNTEGIITEPQPFTPFQKKCLWGLVAFILCASLPPILNELMDNTVIAWIANYFDVYTILAIAGVVAGILLRDKIKCKDVLLEDIPWATIMTICGMGMYVSLITPLGIVDTLAVFIANVPAWLVTPAIIIIAGVLAAFVNGNVVQQAIIPLFVTACEVYPQLPLLGTYMSIYVGQIIVSGSPFSTGGALALMGYKGNEEEKDKLIRQMLAHSFILMGIAVIVALLGWFRIQRP